jgi:ATP-dependent helicase/nuclease subunit A
MKDDATLRQIAAADPDRSTWLSANAGSGKTRVLTDRVARLLLNGVPPQNVLCLTYTKAAAGEMQNRLFRRLGGWAMLDDARLAAELDGIGVEGAIGAERLAQARRLFASAVETPGGLKIQTIHSFCASILRQFPLEAGVSPGFREIDDRESTLILRELFDALAEGPDAPILAAFARHCSATGLQALLKEIVNHAAAFEQPATDAEIFGWFGLDGSERPEAIIAAALSVEGGLLPDLIAVLRRGPKTVVAKAEALAGHESWTLPQQRFEALCAHLLTQAGTPVAQLRKTTAKEAPDLLAELEALQDALAAALIDLSVLDNAQKTLALHRFGRLYIGAYRRRKAAAGLLDFDDLIRRTLALLSRSALAQWVLFRLDGGIDHILVDEAQDTSPPQWEIIERLAQEFAAGAGARAEVLRTIFAVGDRKQSIYSFQGADPAEFQRMMEHFRARLQGASRPFQDLELQHSFRSSPLILRLVDRVFATGATAGVSAPTTHAAFHPHLPGRVDLWPLLEEDGKEALPEWHDPSDRTDRTRPALVLADRIAAEVRRMVDCESLPDGSGGQRPVAPGDVLILVRRRSFITDPLILALKKAGLPVAGSDQIELASDLAVMDIVAVLKVLVTPADSLSLAAALRSPLFGISEAELYTLAQGRGDATLWEVLDRRRDDFPQAFAILSDLRRQADYLRPFELIARLLVRHGGRRRLLARLGDEIDEAIDVLLAQALAYEASEVPSLTGFLTWHEAEGVKIKRQSDSAGGKVRVMTVHGAKGLESEIVILPDTADHRKPPPTRLIRLANGQPVFRARKEQVPPTLASVYEAEEQRAEEESNRLLYVALTRPRRWLIVCGAGSDAAKDDKLPCWHRLVAEAMSGLGPAAIETPGGPLLRLEHGAWPQPVLPRDPQALDPLSDPAPLPDWTTGAAEPGPPLPVVLSPSGLGGMAKGGAPVEVEAEDALLRGTRLHLLLELLPLHPESAWPDIAAAFLRAEEDAATDAEIGDLLAEASAVLREPDLAWLFAEGSLAEVGITAALPQLDGRRISGRIDRLIRTDGHVLAVDYKSNRVVPDRAQDIPEGILLQLGAYAAALDRIFPGDRVEVAVLWTRAARLMRIPREIVT